MKKIFLILLCLVPILTGCYNYRELNDLAIISALSITKVENNYKVTAQIINPKKETDASKGDQPDFITYEKTAQSIQEALRKMILESPKKIYAAHLQVLILEETLAKEDISPILDFLFRDPEVRDEFYVLVASEKDIVDIITPLDNISAQNITDSLETTNKYLGLANLVTFNDLMSTYLNEKKELALPSIQLQGNTTTGKENENVETTEADADIFISNIAVFKDNKMLGYLTEQESIAFNFIENNITDTLITSNFEDGFIVHEIIECNTKTEANPQKNKITITISGTSSISEITTSQNLTKNSSIEKVQKKLNEDIENLIKNSIQSINQKYNSDIYGFQELYYKTDPTYYKTIKDKWYQNIFSNIEIEVKSNITIQEKGNLIGGIYQ